MLALLAAISLAATPPLRLSDLLRDAHQKNPTLQAATLRVTAADAAIAPAGALDDPMLMVQLWNAPADFSSVPVMVQLTQNLPLGNKRGLRRDAASAELKAAQAHVEVQRQDLDAEIEKAYFALYMAERADAVDAELSRTLIGLRQAALSRVSAGLGQTVEVLRTQSAQIQVDADRVVAQQQARSARARLRALLDLPPDAELGIAVEPKLVDTLPDEATLRTRALGQRPELTAAEAMISGAETEAQLAHAERIPDVGIFAAGMHTFRGIGEQNFFFAGAQINLPIFGGSKSGPRTAAATSKASALRAEQRSLQNQIVADLADARAQVEAEGHLVALHHQLVPLSREALTSVLHGYAIGRSDFPMVIDTLRELQMHQLELASHLGLYEQRLAELERAAGMDLGLVAAAEGRGVDASHE
jgi:cobalt-zinc-cadmium efflux system outer membrane protein